MSSEPVLKVLPWEENSCGERISTLLEGKKVVSCALYQDAEDKIEMVMEVEDAAQRSCVLFSASTDDDTNHRVVHAYLSDEAGKVVEQFPLGGAISSVCYVQREEQERTWLCGGYESVGGCIVTGIRFIFDVGCSSGTIILHCWGQCKPVPFCGDPHTPQYSCWVVHRLISDQKWQEEYDRIVSALNIEEMTEMYATMRRGSSAVQEGKVVSFLPADFIGSAGHGFWPFDASGMHILKPENEVKVHTRGLELVKRTLGLGCWDEGPLLKFRKDITRSPESSTVDSEALLFLRIPSLARMFSSSGSEEELLRKIGLAIPDSILLCGNYDSAEEFVSLPDKLLCSRELNGVLLRPATGISGLGPKCLVFPASKANGVLLESFKQLQNEEGVTQAPRGPANSIANQTMKLSVRFTLGMSLPLRRHRAFARDSEQGSLYQSSVTTGCKGGSLGYHLTSSSDFRNVITLHGSLDNLLADLSGKFGEYRAEIDAKRESIRSGRVQQVIGPRERLGHHGSDGLGWLAADGGPGDNEVMSLRIFNPSPEAALACAQVLDGTIPYDARNNALYPVHCKQNGNLKLPAACAVILEVLVNMKNRLSGGRGDGVAATSISAASSGPREGVLRFEFL